MTAHLVLAPNQWKMIEGVKVENTTQEIVRVDVSVLQDQSSAFVEWDSNPEAVKNHQTTILCRRGFGRKNP